MEKLYDSIEGLITFLQCLPFCKKFRLSYVIISSLMEKNIWWLADIVTTYIVLYISYRCKSIWCGFLPHCKPKTFHILQYYGSFMPSCILWLSVAKERRIIDSSTLRNKGWKRVVCKRQISLWFRAQNRKALQKINYHLVAMSLL